MRVFLAFLLYLAGCMLLSALLLPWLQPLFAALLGATPDRSLYRFGMLLGLLGLPWLLRRLDLTAPRLMGIERPPGVLRRELLAGLTWGIGLMALVLALLLASGVRYIPEGQDLLPRLAAGAAGGLISGLAVGLIEEFFFRGPLQGGMRRSLPILPVALATGAFYAAVHFVRPAPLPPGTELDIPAALGMLGGGLANLRHFADYADSFLALLAAGVFLALTRERTGRIWFAIGMHAGWVMMIRVAKKTSRTDHGSPWAWLIGDYDNITGWLAAALLAACALLYWRITRNTQPMRNTTF